MSATAEPRTWTVETLLRWATEDFRARGITTPRLDAELLLGLALSRSRIELIVGSKRPLAAWELSSFRDLVRRRRAREPVAYILGVREFYGRLFRVDPRVLVPRPDSEALVETALERSRHRSLSMRALDLCTGSGCIGATLARERPTAKIFGTDASPDAVEAARENALRLGAYNMGFAVGNLFDAVGNDCRFDVIVANPPYVASDQVACLAPEIRDHEPRVALDGGPDGLAVTRRIVAGAPTRLAPGGCLAVEVGAGSAAAVARLFEQAGLAEVQTRRDLAGIQRVVSGVLHGG